MCGERAGGTFLSYLLALNCYIFTQCESYQKTKQYVNPPSYVNKDNFTGQVWNKNNIDEQQNVNDL